MKITTIMSSVTTRLAGLALMGLGALLAVMMASFSPTDPSYHHAVDGSVANIGGLIGAYSSDMFLQISGMMGFTLPIALMVWGICLFWQAHLSMWFIRLLALLGGILGGAAVSAHFPLPAYKQVIEAPGLVGQMIHGAMGPAVPLYLLMGLGCASLSLLWLALCWTIPSWSSVVLRLLQPYWMIAKPAMMLVRGLFSRTQPVSAAEETDLLSSSKKPRKNKSKALTSPSHQPVVRYTHHDTGYVAPDTSLLSMPPAHVKQLARSSEAIEHSITQLMQVLMDFGISGKILNVSIGPVVVLYEFEPASGIKSSRIIGLADDIARSMSATAVRIAVVPGRNVIGIELPNPYRETVYMRPLLESADYRTDAHQLPLILGKDIAGNPVISDLAKMPHLLVAGTTGSGKSVGINTMIMSLIFRLSPEECKFIMIDPKMLELSVYDGIPHLLAPVVTEPKKAVLALKWTVKEMERRYRLMAKKNVRNIGGYNLRMKEEIERAGSTAPDATMAGEEKDPLQPLPYIVVIVDEMADLMLVAGKEIETSIQRLAQMARAAGIHIIMATQRPSVDVITGVIKANFPTRISFQVTSRIDSRTILGEQGAEQLLGMGDMLWMVGGGRITRVHGPYVSDREVEHIVSYLKEQGQANYSDDITADDSSDIPYESEGEGGDLYRRAVEIVIRDKKPTTSYLQRRLQIGYNRAASLIERMEDEGIVSAPNHVGKRDIITEGA